MAFGIGVLLALFTCGSASVIGFDRARSFYPVVVIVIASYYSLFAVMTGSAAALWQDTAIAMLFAASAVIGFRSYQWLVVAALAAHGLLDAVHHQIVGNPGVPSWWPGFCSGFDIAAAAYLAARIVPLGPRPSAAASTPDGAG